MKLFIIIALCLVAALAVPVDETQQTSEDDSQITLLELEPDALNENVEDIPRFKRQWGEIFT